MNLDADAKRCGLATRDHSGRKCLSGPRCLAGFGSVIATCLLCLAVLPGCGGGGGVTVTGVVTIDGETVRPERPRVIKVALRPHSDVGEPFSANPNDLPSPTELAAWTADVLPDGSFELPDVPRGEYRVIASDFSRFPSDDRLSEHFRSSPDSLTVELPSPDPLEIRLDGDWYSSGP